MDCAYQNNSDDCGLYALANAVAEAFGIDPTMQEYDTELMRGHLIHCLEQNELSLFPARSRESSFAGGVRYSAYLKVFCTCQMPEEGHYVICDKCKIWYHPSCEGLDINEIPESGISYFCKKCLNPKRKKKKIISLLTTIQFLKSFLIYISYMFLTNFKVNILQKCQK